VVWQGEYHSETDKVNPFSTREAQDSGSASATSMPARILRKPASPEHGKLLAGEQLSLSAHYQSGEDAKT
jgi:hypothetical protein